LVTAVCAVLFKQRGEWLLKYRDVGIFVFVVGILYMIVSVIHAADWYLVTVMMLASLCIVVACVLVSVQMADVDFRVAALHAYDEYKHPTEYVVRMNNRLIMAVASLIVLSALSIINPGWILMPFVWLFRLIRLITTAVLPETITWFVSFEDTVTGAQTSYTNINDLFDPEYMDSYLIVDIPPFFLYPGFLYFFALSAIILVFWSIVTGKFIFQKREKDIITDVLLPDEDIETKVQSSTLSNLRTLLPGFKHLPHTRRVFAKKVQKYIHKGFSITRCHTVSEIEKKILTEEDIHEIASQYKKIRYGRPS